MPWWPEWVIDAACRNYDPEIFFDFGRSGKNREKIARAKRICFSCPVIRECLRDNLRMTYGIFGGLTPYERWKLLRMKGRRKRSKLEFSPYVQRFSPLDKISKKEYRRTRSSSELMQNYTDQNQR